MGQYEGFQLYSIGLPVYLVPEPSWFQDYSSVIELEVRDGDASRSSFIVQASFGYPGFLFPYIKLRIVLSRSVKNCVVI